MKKILVIDDDSELLEIVEHILKTRGFDVQTDASASNVSDVVKHYRPHLILLDILLYGKSGMEICKELKRKHHTPIILFSADIRKGEAFADCDADDFISKPFNIEDLTNTISRHLKVDKAEV